MNCLLTEPNLFPQKILRKAPKKWKFFFLKYANQKKFELLLRKNNYDVIFGRLGLKFSRNVFKLQPKLKILVSPTTGLNHIDLVAAQKAKVKILSLKEEKQFLKKISSTAEHAWALVLAGARNLPECCAKISNGNWNRSNLEILQLRGKKIGIIGYGRLGKILGRYARAFGMQISVCDKKYTKIPNYCIKTKLDCLCKNSNVIVLVASCKAGDPVILKKKHFLSMQKGTLFVNVARGELICEKGLLMSIRQNRLRYAGLDVLRGDSTWSENQQVKNSVLSSAKKTNKILVTPHVGGYAIDALKESRELLLKKLNLFI